MSSAEAQAAVREDLRRGHRSGRLAHAWIVEGDPHREGGDLARWMARLVLCAREDGPCGVCRDCRTVESWTHPDLHRVVPEGKSRQITVEAMRVTAKELYLTSFSGGWKALAVLEADRMGIQACNAFLKTLEEPPPRTLILLVAADPSQMIATIRSRCQTARAGRPPLPDGPWREVVLEVAREGAPASVLDALRASHRLAAVLDEAQKTAVREIKAETADEDLEDDEINARAATRMVAVREALLETLLAWQRDVLVLASGGPAELLGFPDQAETLSAQAARLGRDGAIRAVNAVETMATAFRRNLKQPGAFEAGFLSLIAT